MTDLSSALKNSGGLQPAPTPPSTHVPTPAAPPSIVPTPRVPQSATPATPPHVEKAVSAAAGPAVTSHFQKDMSQDAISHRLDTYVKLDDYSNDASQRFNYRGSCAKCGWQTHQMEKGAAVNASHAVMAS